MAITGSDPGSVTFSAKCAPIESYPGDHLRNCPTTHGPESGLETVRAFFEDPHHHMALIVAPDGRLVTTIERPDLAARGGPCPWRCYARPLAALRVQRGRSLP